MGKCLKSRSGAFTEFVKRTPAAMAVYEFCHVPIDNYILNITGYKLSKPWSKLNDYREYLEYQSWFRNKYPNDIPLDKEFYLWLEAAKNNSDHI